MSGLQTSTDPRRAVPPDRAGQPSDVTSQITIAVDRIACSGHGICAQVLAGTLDLDEFGYPVQSRVVVDPADAAAAIRLCPARALRRLPSPAARAAVAAPRATGRAGPDRRLTHPAYPRRYGERVPLPTPPTTPRQLPRAEARCAGGCVIDVHEGRARIAVIARRNRSGHLEWCLPKGHLEAGETPEQAAVREVAEETGIQGRVLVTLGTIDYWFDTPQRRIHKVVHHYLLEALGGELSIEGDPDCEAIDVAWVELDHADQRLTFPNERRIARAAWERLSGTA